jgi:hypothetical protein
MPRMDLAVRRQCRRWESRQFKQLPDKGAQVIHLPLRRRRLVKITDQTNPNARPIQLLARQMAALNLLSPSLPNKNFSIIHPSPVSDQKVVRQAVLHVPLFTMKLIDPLGGSLPCSAMMNHNVFPRALHTNGIELLAHFSVERRRSCCPRRNLFSNASSLACGIFSRENPGATVRKKHQQRHRYKDTPQLHSRSRTHSRDCDISKNQTAGDRTSRRKLCPQKRACGSFEDEKQAVIGGERR